MNRNSIEITSDRASSTSRRRFLRTSTTAALGSVFAANLNLSQKTFAATSETLRVGLIGCGGRGTGAANQALNADKNVILTAMAERGFRENSDIVRVNARKWKVVLFRIPQKVTKDFAKEETDRTLIGASAARRSVAQARRQCRLETPARAAE